MTFKELKDTSDEGLRILIVGAGIGGLTAAIALRQQGHHVEVSDFVVLVAAVPCLFYKLARSMNYQV